jgi:crotonobetainyl-CoA:carnitine CoA-transferase CaiB-like acyl-CoA transferase
VIGYDQLGIVKQRRGNRIEEDSPRNAFATRDGAWITISASSDRTFARLAEAIGDPGLATDPRFADNRSRIENDAVLDELIASWMRARGADEIMAVLESHDVVAGRIYTIEDIFRDVQYEARENIVAVEDPDFGSVRMPGVVPRFSRSPGAVRWPGGRLGEHNEQVFGALGLDGDDLATLRAEGVV